ncbi:hypothetical protein BDN70DRAFT_901356 [Pholiota conissans]|uniref:Uncharacterized protein n=1 Tax=Pholiota conissans TaxID=109636 RepID=A0A9P5YPQ1_9AGAR|nr:hypothetical protein BDN70DRAFT_901356 [Pholiota conissans]
MDDDITYVTAVKDAPKPTRYQVFYQRNSRRLKQEARERWQRNRKKIETLSKPEQDEAMERRRRSAAAYREKHRDELREKERLRRYFRALAKDPTFLGGNFKSFEAQQE